MSKQLTIDDARQSLSVHLAAKGIEVHQKYGRVGWLQLLRLLQDRSCVRYPCEIKFDAEPLLPGEFGHPIAKGQTPEEGFTLYVHPFFATRLERVPLLALYQLVLVNYGDFVSADDAETFGSQALGLSKDEYYHAVCDLADQLHETCPTNSDFCSVRAK
jgi:hypothetical protein